MGWLDFYAPGCSPDGYRDGSFLASHSCAAEYGAGRVRAFSYSRSQVPDVIAYIHNQEQHHCKKTFAEEYIEFLKKFKIEYDEQFVFKEPV